MEQIYYPKSVFRKKKLFFSYVVPFSYCWYVIVIGVFSFQGLLHYQITNSQVKLSEIFSKMEAIKESYSVVEDYTVSDTTLEQVFIAFAKKRAIVNLSTK